jgi:predicted protein tyrosine phosphatase
MAGLKTGLMTGAGSGNTTDQSAVSARSGIILVGPAHVIHAEATAEASHVVTLINAQLMPTIATPARLAPERHLRLVMSDLEEAVPGRILPNSGHVADLIAFVSGWDRAAPLLIHCLQGVSRSTAAAFISLCALNPDADELVVARRLRQASASAAPNRLLVRLADEILRREGRMSAAIASIGAGDRSVEGELFSLPARI